MNNVIFERLTELWKSRKATEKTIQAAIDKGWISQEEAEQILTTPRV